VPSREVIAFGSRVTGRAKPFSDLDLAIMGEVAVPTETLAALADDFDESDLPFKVDLVEWAGLVESFKDVIRRDALTLQVPKASA
jgi:predicted nucleotidyltransferase